ncbi:nucleotide exchange factor GrpE [Globicatella sp. PHS-GS-PNBC-21-1553]|uniref:nucleotide exchange factor GrpE n=1 Tax=Globicatella sp. PHS-GS-PNBC-21-1553 TaxID=2885764 RepID=UPI00298EFD36|nr:nucleotide exchange factor GrpE [Globicatella sp. PHS-GS-PNBC-21-1553]WPC08401.1 nucleotide exchange factor GrpE [Globicatella sp. PHS-GS-PNBC-21-1553]
MAEENKRNEELEKDVPEVEVDSQTTEDVVETTAEVKATSTDEETVETTAEVEATSTVEETVETKVEENPLAELEAKNDALEDQVLRLQAEIANMKRSNAKDRQDLAKYRSQKLATSMLEVVDNLERALQSETNSDDAKALKKGVEMVLSQLQNAFESENIKVIDPMGEKFDPNFHQAVSVMEAEEGQDSDVVINVLQKGYLLHERVIRPAMVIVSQ